MPHEDLHSYWQRAKGLHDEVIYLEGCRLVFVVFCICFQVFNIHIWQPRDQQLQFLFIEDRNQPFWYDIIEAFQEAIDPATTKLSLISLSCCGVCQDCKFLHTRHNFTALNMKLGYLNKLLHIIKPRNHYYHT